MSGIRASTASFLWHKLCRILIRIKLTNMLKPCNKSRLEAFCRHTQYLLPYCIIDSCFRLQELSTNGNVAQNKSVDQLEKIEDIVKLEKIVSELEKDCEKFQKERDAAKEKLAAHDVAAKRAITALQKEMTLRVDQVRIHFCFAFLVVFF